MSNDTLVGRLLDDRYRIGDRIARGGMASVYIATDVRLDRTVAVKIMHSGLGDDEEFTARFEREARSAAKLNHPNVVAVFDQGEDRGIVYLVMEYVPGRTLRDVIRDEAPMPPRRALALIDPLLIALGMAHGAKIIHRDIKPENVLISPEGQTKVADFGLARAVSSATTSTATSGVLIGTVSYLAPELVVHEGADTRSDVYAVGAVLYEMLTGSKPHVGDSPIQVAYKHVHEDVPPPSETIPGTPPYVDALVARATARDRDQRSADASVLLRQVRRTRSALDLGLRDDPDLTQDLLPRAVPATAPLPEDDPTAIVPTSEPVSPLPPDRTQDTVPVNVPAPTDFDPAEPPDQQTRPRRRRRGLLLLIVLLLIALLAGLGGWYYGIGRFDDTPDYEGMALKRAEHSAKVAGYTLDVSDTSYSETVPKGAVISTEPAPGERILPDGTIDATISKGKERYPVPPLEGKTEDQARDLLSDRNLALGDVTEKYHEKVKKGLIVSSAIDAETQVPRDTEVDVVVSKGRRPIDVEDFTGEPLSAARKALGKADLDPEVRREYSADVDKGDVISQDPSDGTLFKGDTVELVVSDGPEPVAVPNVVGKNEAEATKILEDAGFEVETEKERFYVGGSLVLRQSPAGTEKLAKGSTVTIYIV